METVKVAFIGAGHFAKEFHYSSLSKMEDVRIVAVADLNEALLHETADRYKVPGRYTNHRDMLAKESIDVVYVITSPKVLKPLVLDVIATGKHVFTEKPPGVSTKETAEMAEAAAKAGVKSGAGLNRRYSNVLRKAKAEVLQRGPISTVMAEFHKNMDEPYYGLSVLHTDGIHVLDAMRDLLGEPETVCAHADWWYTKEKWEASYNCFQALIRFAGGGSGVFVANRQCGTRLERFELHGQGISAFVRTPEVVEIYRAGQSKPEIYTGKELAGTDDPLHTYGYFVENREFIDCVKHDTTPLTNFEDALKTMRLCDKINLGTHVDNTTPVASRKVA